MDKNKVTIFVACHKPADIYTDEVYIPIHVGRAVSKFKEEMKDMIGDDTGDNISDKNPYYSEMTAQYWAWKNFHKTEYIGFCHYRRYFYEKVSSENIDSYFADGTDVLVVGPSLKRYSRWCFLQNFICIEDLVIMQKAIQRIHPDYYETMSQYGFDFIDYPFNMYICKKEVFDQYAEWIFSILFECEKYVKLSPYSRARRLYGYLSEFLMPVFFMHNKFKIKPLHYSKENGKKMGGLSLHHRIMRYVLRNLIYFRDKKNIIEINNDALIGLKNDGVVL